MESRTMEYAQEYTTIHKKSTMINISVLTVLYSATCYCTGDVTKVNSSKADRY